MLNYRGRVVLKRKLQQGMRCNVLCGKHHKMVVSTEPLLRLQLGRLKSGIRMGKIDEKLIRPAFHCVTPSPTSTTSPADSWPDPH